jgi:preprotein translocase subunit SecE
VEEVLPAVQQARLAQGNQVTVATESARGSLVRRAITFYQEVIAEMKKVTWPDWPQVRQLSVLVISLSLFVGALIALMDLIFQAIFVRGLPSLFGG